MSWAPARRGKSAEPSHARQKTTAVNAVVFGFLAGVDCIRRQTANFFDKLCIGGLVVVLHKF
jgi:hypothetical protein